MKVLNRKMKKITTVLLTFLLISTLGGCGSDFEGYVDNDVDYGTDGSVNTSVVAGEDTDASADAGNSESGGGTAYKVGVSLPTKDLQRWVQDGKNMQDSLKAAGFHVDLQYADNDVDLQCQQIQSMIESNCNILVIGAVDGNSLSDVLAQAKEKDIPVIAYDRLIMDSDAVTYYATFDNQLVGTLQGEYIVNQLDLDNAAGPFYIELFTGSPDDNNCNFFFGGAMDVLQPYIDAGKLVVKSGQTSKDDCSTEGWASDVAQERMDSLLQQYYSDGTKLDAVLSSNDSVAQGIAASLSANYNGEYPILTGQDCDITSVKNILNGKQSMSIFKDTRTLAAKVVEMVKAVKDSAEVPVNDEETYDNGTGVIPSYLCEPVFADAQNYEEILIDSGYYTLDQLQ